MTLFATAQEKRLTDEEIKDLVVGVTVERKNQFNQPCECQILPEGKVKAKCASSTSPSPM
jgi:hypothetical protein